MIEVTVSINIGRIEGSSVGIVSKNEGISFGMLFSKKGKLSCIWLKTLCSHVGSNHSLLISGGGIVLPSMIVGWSMGCEVMGVDEQVAGEKCILGLKKLLESLKGLGWKVSDKSYVLMFSSVIELIQGWPSSVKLLVIGNSLFIGCASGGDELFVVVKDGVGVI
jgi:hypothetical protein